MHFCDSGFELLQSSAFNRQFSDLSFLFDFLTLVSGLSLLILDRLELPMYLLSHLQARLAVFEDFLFVLVWVFGGWEDVSIVLLADCVEGLEVSVFR